LAVVVGVGVLLGAASALAEEAPVRDEGADEGYVTTKRWYGWQTLTADAVPAMMFLATVPASGEHEAPLWITGSLAFAFGGPAVHLANGRPLAALGSLGLRLTAPVLGLAVGAGNAQCEPDHDPIDPGCSYDDTPLIVGGLIGAAVASGVDASLIAVESQRHRRYSAQHRSLVVPSLEVRSNGARLSLTGNF
jgi:hypothetical protein